MTIRTTTLRSGGSRARVAGAAERSLPVLSAPVLSTMVRLRTNDRGPDRDEQADTHVRIPLSGAEHPLWTARHAVLEQCADRLPEHTVDDLQLIVSELVANILEHGGGADGLAIDLAFHGTDVDLQVIGHGDRRLLPPFDEWSLPSATRRSGRGLALVRRLSHAVAIGGETPTGDEPGWVTITASVRTTL